MTDSELSVIFVHLFHNRQSMIEDIAKLNDYIDKINCLVLYLGNIKTTVVASAGMHITLLFTTCAAWGRHTKIITRKRARCDKIIITFV